MIDIIVDWYPAENYWLANATPKNLPNNRSAWIIGQKNLNKYIRNYYLNDLCISDPNQSVLQTSTIHGRSCYLGEDSSHNHYFAKGVGWVLADGWMPELGSLGILPLWAAVRERDIANYLLKLGLNTVVPVSIELHKKIPLYLSGGSNFLDSNSVLDLDGTKANPAMYVYSARSRWRLADLAYLGEKEVDSLMSIYGGAEVWLAGIIEKLSESVAMLHSKGGYDYSLSAHNVFVSGERLDFEYVVVEGIPHRDEEMNKNRNIWVNKELYGLKLLSWEISELIGVNWSSSYLDSLIKGKYEEITATKFPL
jgi:hypothetical protein